MDNPWFGRWFVLLACAGLAAGAGCGGRARPMVEMARYSTVLVVGVTDDSDLRRSYEGSFEVRFSEHNVVALSSLPMMPPGQRIDRESIEAVIRSTGIDAVLITWMVGPEQQGQGSSPPESAQMYEHYATISDTVRTPGYLQQVNVVQLETRLYDANTGELVLSLHSDVFKRGSVEEAIQAVSRTLVSRLIEANLF